MALNSWDSKSVKMAAAREVSPHWSVLETRSGESPIRLLNLTGSPPSPQVDRRSEDCVYLAKPAPKEPDFVKNRVDARPQDFGIPRDAEKSIGASAIIAEDYCISWKSGEQWLCEICGRESSGRHDLADHLAGIEHSTSMKKYGCENIAVIQWRMYQCECCDCKIPGKKNVCVHLRGKRHAACRSAMQRAKESVTDESSSQPNTAKSSNDIAELLRSYRVKTAERMARRRRAAAQATSEKVACDFCSFAVDNGADLHSHLASHLSADFTGGKLDENENLRYSSDPSNEPEHFSCIAAQTVEQSCEALSHVAEHVECLRPLSHEKTLMRIVARRLDSNQDHIYEMRQKKDAAKLSAGLCLVQQNESIYCLVCRQSLAPDISHCGEHFSSLDHITDLACMQRDDALFEHAPGQLSELRLALDFMLETPEGPVQCLVCDKDVQDNDEALRNHIIDDAHAAQRRAQRNKSSSILRDALQRACCDWYRIHNYWCVACSANFDSEDEFANHLACAKHSVRLRRMNLSEGALIFDFCASCALLWYGHPTTNVYHCQLSSHKWLLQDGHYMVHDLPEAAQFLLRHAEKYVAENELRVEKSSEMFFKFEKSNEMFFKSINEAFPICRKIILFVRQWLGLCNLTGCGAISECAISWYVVFYLQQESVLPSIASLIAMSSKSRLIDGLNVGDFRDSSHKDAASTLSSKEYLLKFFRFYSDFDYRHDVACPLLGENVKKRLFIEPKKLPREMSACVDYTKKSLKSEPFRVDFPMCMQDPFDLSHNLTQNVSKVYLGRFRNYCAKSHDVLCSF